MRIEYVFIRKENALTKITDKIATTNPPLHFVLRKIFSNVSDDTITLKYKAKEYSISYRYIEHECEKIESTSDIQYLTVNLDGKNKARVAEVLDTVHRSIFDHKEKANYDIIVSYDGISKYYCDRAYPLLNEFERQIRNLIFKMLTRSFGALWLEKTATQEQQDSLKKKLQIRSKPLRNQKMIEEALYEMDIKELENYLFVPRSDMVAAELRADEFTNEKLSELSQEAAIKLIQKLRPMSIWERYFDKEVRIPNLQEKLDSIRNYRNKVAHAKHFHKSDYDACKEILAEILPQLENAIHDIAVKEYDSAQLQEAIRGIADTCASAIKNVIGIGKALSPVLETFSRSVAEFGTLIQQSAVSQAMQVQNQFEGMNRAMVELSSVLSAIPTQSVLQSAMQVQKNWPSPSVLENIAASQVRLPDTSVMKSMEVAVKAMPSPAVMTACQSVQPFIQKPEILKSMELATRIAPVHSELMDIGAKIPSFQIPALSAVLQTSQTMEQMTRFQNVGVGIYEDIDDPEEDGNIEKSSDGTPDDGTDAE